MSELRPPFPYFGGKRRIAAIVWQRFGDVPNYVEPFCGSAAVLLARPTAPRIETVNDMNCFISNFWRAVAEAPEETAAWCDWPINEADLHARHRWLMLSTEAAEWRERMKRDPHFYDAKIAGWWVWGACQWIGAGWCDGSRLYGEGATRHGKLPEVADNRGINAAPPPEQQSVADHRRPHLSSQQSIFKRPRLTGYAETGIFSARPRCSGASDRTSKPARECMPPPPGTRAKAPGNRTRNPWRCGSSRQRYRRTRSRAWCGRTCTPVEAASMLVSRSRISAVIATPPAARFTAAALPTAPSCTGLPIYRCGFDGCASSAATGRESSRRRSPWGSASPAFFSTRPTPLRRAGTTTSIRAKTSRSRTLSANGARRTARAHHYASRYVGYDGEHNALEAMGWEVHAWRAQGGYANQNQSGRGMNNRHRERIWFSPHCIKGPGATFRMNDHKGETMKAASAEGIPLVGRPYGGGILLGRFFAGSQPYLCIKAPRAQGELEAKAWSASLERVDGALSAFDGLANTRAMLTAGSDAAKWATDLRIGGHDDWYLWSRGEALIGYDVREVLAAEEAFDDESAYWTSTQDADAPDYAWCQGFGNGGQGWNPKGDELRVVAVRRVPIQQFTPEAA